MEERAYSFAASLLRELERMGSEAVKVGIGDIVDKPEDIFRSFKTARHIRHLLTDRQEEKFLILGAREMGEILENSGATVQEHRK